MAAKKVLDANEASLVDLKAELFRKEEQFKRGKHNQGNNLTKQYSKKPPIWIRAKKSAVKPVTTISKEEQFDEQSEEEKALDKSRHMLEAKALLYEKMAKGEIEDEEDDDGSSRFLVDFHKKVYGKEVTEDNQTELYDVTGTSKPEEEWVDYVDSLGRSRRCMKQDLQRLQQMDKDFTPRKSPSPPTLLSEDMRRELQRQKWEKEEEEAIKGPVGPVHYQNVQFDEVRTHGVGYYQFSKDELERQKQMEMLNTLRQQTTEQRARRERLKEKRKAALEARLAKVRAKKVKKLDEGGEMVDQQLAQDATEKQEVGEGDELKEEAESFPVKAETLQTTSREPEQNIPKSKLPEWARHKIALTSKPKTSAYDAHEERDPEFAPPSFYYNQDSSKSGSYGENTRHRTAVHQNTIFRGNKSLISDEHEPQTNSPNMDRGAQMWMSATPAACRSLPYPPSYSANEHRSNYRPATDAQPSTSKTWTVDNNCSRLYEGCQANYPPAYPTSAHTVGVAPHAGLAGPTYSHTLSQVVEKTTQSTKGSSAPSDQALTDFLLQCRQAST